MYFLGIYYEAITSLNKAIGINPKDAEVWNNKGNALNSLGRYGESISSYDKAIKIDPSYAGVWNNKGLARQPVSLELG